MKNIFNKIRIFLKKVLPKSEPSLMRLVDKKRKIDGRLKKILNKKGLPLWAPSLTSFWKIFTVMFLFWAVSHPKYIVEWLLIPIHRFLSDFPYYKSFVSPILQFLRSLPSFQIPLIGDSFDPITIHAGIGAVLIGLAFFVAQSLNEKNDSEKARVLLYRSAFFPLLMAEIMAFFLFIGETNILGFIPIIAIALWTIYSLGSVIDILVRAYKMEEAKKEVLLSVTKNNFVKILDREITKRIGNNALYKRYENSGILNVSPFGFFDRKEIVSIKSAKTGWVSDIKLKELEKLIAELNQATDNMNISDNADVTSNRGNATAKQEPVSYMRALLHNKIEAGDTLFEIKKSIVEQIGIRKVTKIAQDIFVIQRDDTEGEARIEISKLKDKCITAINDQQTGELEKIMRLYVELVNEFFTFFNLYGGGFSAEQAQQERGAFLERLKPLEWLSKDIREIFERGINSADINIIRDAAYLPILLAQEAIESKDHLIFQEFIYFPRLLYERAYELDQSGNKKASEIMFDRTWRYLKELSVYHLESKLKDEDYPEQDFKDYSIQILKIFQELLKSAIDKQDIKNFEQFLSVVSELFDRLDRPYNRLAHSDVEDIHEYLEGKRLEMFFGVASWIFFLLKHQSADEKLKQLYNAVQNKLPSKIEDFTDTFLNVHEFKIGNFWGWDWWEARPDEGVHQINTLEKLEQFFIIKSLSILRSKSEQEIKEINLPHNRDLAFLAEGTRDVMKTIDDIEKNPAHWKFILDDNAIAKCSDLRDLLKRAHEQQEQDDLKRKREAKISSSKVEKFKKNLALNYTQSQPFKEVLKTYGLFSDQVNPKYKGSIKKRGINTMFDKSPFFGEDMSWHVHYIGLDEAFGFGRSLAHAENEEILQKIETKATVITKSEFEATLESIKTSNIIIIGSNQAIWKFFERSSENYIPKWRQDFPNEFANPMIEGVLKYKRSFIPVYEVFTPGADNSKIFILDKSKLGRFIQYSPLDEKDPIHLQHDIFLINVQEFISDTEPMKEFLNKPPQWLKDVGDQEKKIEYLQERVLIHAFERFEFVVHPKFVGYVMTVIEAQ